MSNSVVIVGAFGAMGRVSVRTISAQSELHLVGELGRKDSLPDRLSELKPDLAIDFTEPNCVKRHLELYLELGIRPVVGTTGLSKREFEELAARYSQARLGGAVVPNFSLAATLLLRFGRELTRHYPSLEIIEYHHPGKLDRPSGTALHFQSALSGERASAPSSMQARAGDNPIPVHSIRMDGFLASQEVLFGGPGERISLRHDTLDRQCYMPGLILTCHTVLQIDELLFGLEAVLDQNPAG